MKKPLSDRTEAELQFRKNQLKSLEMPTAVLGQPPARGTLGFVVCFPDSVFPTSFPCLLTSPLFSLSPPSTWTSWSPHVLTYDYTTHKSLLRVPVRRGRRPASWDYSSQKSFGAVLPSLVSRTTIPRDFSITAVLFSFGFFLSWLGFGWPAGAKRRRDPS